jgi:DNA-binding XRE family transcriptional regulator
MSEGGFIYAIGAVGSPYVKIGSTRGSVGSVTRRLNQLQIGHPFPLVVLATVAVDHDAQQLEKAMHRLLVTQRQHGEWFALAVEPDTLTTLAAQAAQSLQPDSVGESIRRFRQKRGLTQRQLATAARVPQPLISQVESGKRPGAQIHLAVAARLAFALGVSVDSLAGELAATENAA